MKEMEEWKFFNIKVCIFLFLISFLLIYKQTCSKVSETYSDCHTIYIPSDEVSINYLCGEYYGKFYYEIESNNYASSRLTYSTEYDINNVKSKEYRNYSNISVFSDKLRVSVTGDYFVDVSVGNTQGKVLSKVIPDSGCYSSLYKL